MKKLIASIGIAAALGGGAFALNTVMPAGAQTGGPSAAAADCKAPGRVGVLHDALDKLVQNGTITQAQEDTIVSTVQDTAKSDGFKGRRGRRAMLVEGSVQVAAGTIGISPEELAQDVRNGQSIADVATAHQVDPKTVVDALVAAGGQRLDTAVAGGKVSQDRADAAKAKLPQIADRVVNHTPQPRCEAPAAGSAPDSSDSSSTSS
jgi:hypothetical protein